MDDNITTDLLKALLRLELIKINCRKDLNSSDRKTIRGMEKLLK